MIRDSPPVEIVTVKRRESLREALKVIDRGAIGACFVVDDDHKLAGVLSDGDVRRSLLTGGSLDDLISTWLRPDYVSLPSDSPSSAIRSALTSRIRFVPLVDVSGCLVDYASHARMPRIPVLEPVLGETELEYLTDCIRTGWVSSSGPYVRQFEEMIAASIGVPHTVAVSNGTVALHLALISLEIGPGDEVIVPDVTFAASANAIIHAGAEPVFCDIDTDSWNIDAHKAADLVGPRTKAIMPVHLYGNPCAMDELVEVADRNGLRVIEDCAESLGSTYRGRSAGRFGDASTLSFFGNKVITTGEGGMICFQDADAAERARLLRDHGMSRLTKYWHDVVGYNYRMTNMQAAVGVAQMERIGAILESKTAIGHRYESLFSQIDSIEIQRIDPSSSSNYWLFTVLLPEWSDRDAVAARLRERGIDSRPMFHPLSAMRPYARYRTNIDRNAVAALTSRGLSLPSAASLPLSDVGFIADTLIEAVDPPAFHGELVERRSADLSTSSPSDADAER